MLCLLCLLLLLPPERSACLLPPGEPLHWSRTLAAALLRRSCSPCTQNAAGRTCLEMSTLQCCCCCTCSCSCCCCRRRCWLGGLLWRRLLGLRCHDGSTCASSAAARQLDTLHRHWRCHHHKLCFWGCRSAASARPRGQDPCGKGIGGGQRSRRIAWHCLLLLLLLLLSRRFGSRPCRSAGACGFTTRLGWPCCRCHLLLCVLRLGLGREDGGPTTLCLLLLLVWLRRFGSRPLFGPYLLLGCRATTLLLTRRFCWASRVRLCLARWLGLLLLPGLLPGLLPWQRATASGPLSSPVPDALPVAPLLLLWGGRPATLGTLWRAPSSGLVGSAAWRAASPSPLLLRPAAATFGGLRCTPLPASSSRPAGTSRRSGQLRHANYWASSARLACKHWRSTCKGLQQVRYSMRLALRAQKSSKQGLLPTSPHTAHPRTHPHTKSRPTASRISNTLSTYNKVAFSK